MPEHYIPSEEREDIGIKVFPTKNSIPINDTRFIHYEGEPPKYGDRLKSKEETEEQMLNDPSVIRNYVIRQGKRFSAIMSPRSYSPQHPHHMNESQEFLYPRQTSTPSIEREVVLGNSQDLSSPNYSSRRSTESAQFDNERSGSPQYARVILRADRDLKEKGVATDIPSGKMAAEISANLENDAYYAPTSPAASQQVSVPKLYEENLYESIGPAADKERTVNSGGTSPSVARREARSTTPQSSTEPHNKIISYAAAVHGGKDEGPYVFTTESLTVEADVHSVPDDTGVTLPVVAPTEGEEQVAAKTAEMLTRCAYEEHLHENHIARTQSPDSPTIRTKSPITPINRSPSPYKTALTSANEVQSESRRSSTSSAKARRTSGFDYQAYHKHHHMEVQTDEDFDFDKYRSEEIQTNMTEDERRISLENIPVLGKRNPELVAELKSRTSQKSVEDKRRSQQLLQTEQVQSLLQQLREELTPEKFLEQIPHVTEYGDPIPEWKRQMLARKMASETLASQEAMVKEAVYEHAKKPSPV